MSNLIKTANQIESIRRASQIVGSVLYDLERVIQPGLTPLELDHMAKKMIIERGGKPAFLGYQGFPNTLCISINDAVVHGIPTSRPFEAGDVVGIDAGAIVEGWYADGAITVGLLPRTAATNSLLMITEQALEAGILRARAGNHLGDVQAGIQQVIEAAQLGIIRHLTGHGIGKQLHEPPEIPNYGRPQTGLILQAGMVLCLEPMVTLGSPDVYIDRDGWTIRTRDGSLGAQFEHTILITQSAAEILTQKRAWPEV
jgi:methionyl aminopeptidase